MRTGHTFLATLLALTLVACQTQEAEQQAGIEEPAAVDADAIAASIAGLSQQWAAAAAAADAEALTNLYDDNATVLPPGMSSVQGREAILELYSGMLSEGAYDVALTTENVIVSEAGDLAIEVGSFEDAMGTGKYVGVYGNIDGDWKMIVDTWNTDGSAEAE